MNSIRQIAKAVVAGLTVVGSGAFPSVIQAQYHGAGSSSYGYRSSGGQYHGPYGADKGAYRKSGNQPNQSRQRNKAGAARRRPVSATGSLSLSQDLFSDFGKDSSGGYTLEVKLAPIDKSSAPLLRRCRFNSASGSRSGSVKNIPAGRYTLSARTIAADRSSKAALIGTRCGDTLNPQDGNFVSAFQLSFVQSKDTYGNPIIVSTPGSLWFRP